ncbi:T9SS type A sorting domain-containing protein [Lutibacter sp. A80]|uniref:type IX secretion system anionic LPS delivery protein PorZ n=1 Tax=Lutibacter sp. A80 TaxID=2918453 RepID=UPI001F06EC8C|nr:two-component regulator propeller domain-containing protein [Lutibacter sp. A80]UMB59425.1 T9SS type A sorting domain-containing protein [Lutibacter sp. A80]
MKKIFQILVFCLVTTSVCSQVDFSNNWEDFYSYNNVKDFIKTDNQIHAIVDNAIFKYNVITDEITKISSVNGLSGETTSSLYYSNTFDKLIIGYETGLIEIIDEDGNITILKDIVNFNYSGNKQINNITEYNGNLYISTSFAIIVYNLDKLQFGDTFFIGDQSSELIINEIKITDNTIYAATENGIYTADINNPNLIDFNNWTQLYSGNFYAIEVFNNQVYAASSRSLYKIIDNNLQLQKNYSQTIISLKASVDHLAIATQRYVYAIDTNDVEKLNYVTNTNQQFYYSLNAAYLEGNLLYLGTAEFGILKSTLDNIPNFEEIHPDGPVSNLPFSISVKENHLWVVYGWYDTAYAPRNGRYGVDHFNGNSWYNIPYGNINVSDLVRVTYDPTNIEKVYISSWGGGMLIVENNEITTHWTYLNSGLEWRTRINGSAFDLEGNLWVANGWVDKKIKKFDTEGNWSGFDMSSVMTNPALGLNELVIDKTSNIWIGTRRNGALIFNEEGNQKRALTTEVSNGSLPDPNVRAIEVDDNNRIWIGTQKGLVVLYNPETVFTESVIETEPVIILDEAGIAKKLLGDQVVNSIAVDGANNKWFGTNSGGVLQTNSDGDETLQNFNINNSPLPSNTILNIEIDKTSGKVYFATSKGIVAYNSKVSEYGDVLPEVYAYPNPSTKNNEFITIDGRNGTHLPEGTNIKILDTAGNLVFETNLKESQELTGGTVLWDKTNLAGTKVASGIYIVLLIDSDKQQTAITKIAIIN